ncbi:MAG: 3-hydroxyacyl-CoA dehydrogenase [Arenicella sp.]
MLMLSSKDKVTVIGAGTMGAGIAQVAAAAGHHVVLLDVAEGVAEKAVESIKAGLYKLVEKGKKQQADVDVLLNRIQAAQEFESIRDSRLVIEAIVENIEVKQELFLKIEALCSNNTIIASNTSSISISALAVRSGRPQNIVGMHFFNPAAILKLVEVVSGLHTCRSAAETIYETAKAWGKEPVHVKSTPGFIVNRVARPFYAEALRSVTEQVASVASIDTLMRSCGGFKMGPLELTDLIGQDVNCAVTESVYNSFYQDKRFMPSALQAEMVAAGFLGRKSGRGFYDYSVEKKVADVEPESVAMAIAAKVTGRSLTPIASLLKLMSAKGLDSKSRGGGLTRIEVGEAILQLTDGRTASERAAQQLMPNLVLFDYALDYQSTSHIAISFASQASDAARSDAVRFFQDLDKKVCVLRDVPGMQVMRTVCMLVNEAYDAVNQGVCDATAVDLAMQAGVAYPQGPVSWGKQIGLETVALTLRNIQASYGEERYRVSPLIQAKAYGH